MQNQTKHFLCLLMLSFLVVGCGNDEPQAAAPATMDSRKPEAEADRVELMVEASQASITTDEIPRDTTAILRDILEDNADLPPAGFTIQIDETFVRSSQLRLIIEPDGTGNDSSSDALEAAAAASFEELKASFESLAEAAARDELADYSARAKLARSEVQALQKALQFYQESLRGIPETDATRLKRRKHKLAIDNALAEQIDAEKHVQSLQRQIERSQFATLVRIR